MATGLYCFDSSAILSAWHERYPPNNFPAFWTQMDRALACGLAIVPEPVVEEVERKSVEAYAWLKQRPHAIIGYTLPIQNEAQAILCADSCWTMTGILGSPADPFVVATAIARSLSVVTEEGPYMWNICRRHNVECMRLIDMIRTEAWVIGG